MKHWTQKASTNADKIPKDHKVNRDTIQITPKHKDRDKFTHIHESQAATKFFLFFFPPFLGPFTLPLTGNRDLIDLINKQNGP